ncbi:MAG: 5'-methylthioadenosine/S-adenosylhomocysteine nucleosidase [Bacillota bacterium]|nr:5'-methylthioadenosine/S-adenosylhomocysteine nucleosidase [Bacillota bacterium]
MNKAKIGIVVAVEIGAVLSRYGEPCETQKLQGYTVRTYRGDSFDMFVVDSGAGEISAAMSTQLLIDRFGVDMILNFGAVGALTEEMKTSELCVVKSVIHYDFDTTGWLNLKRGQYPGNSSPYLEATPELVRRVLELKPDIIPTVCASADKFIDKAEDKIALREAYGADICEMEAAGILLTCLRNDIPCLLIKAVSDSLIGGGAEFLQELERVSLVCFDVVDKLLQEIYAIEAKGGKR